MKKVDLTGDGACSGNPGIGSWAYVLEFEGIRRTKTGLVTDTTTNNRMEMTAIIEGLKGIRYPCIVNIFTDSRNVADPFTKGWIEKWKANNFDGRANTDLWEELLKLLSYHSYNFFYIPRNSTPNHAECDRMAKFTIKEYKAQEEGKK